MHHTILHLKETPPFCFSSMHYTTAAFFLPMLLRENCREVTSSCYLNNPLSILGALTSLLCTTQNYHRRPVGF